MPYGDIIAQVCTSDIPQHDLLCAGFPCQPFSIMGGLGFDDVRGTLFFHIARILEDKKPQSFILENVKQIVSHNQGKTKATILHNLERIGYKVRVKYSMRWTMACPKKENVPSLWDFWTMRGVLDCLTLYHEYHSKSYFCQTMKLI